LLLRVYNEELIAEKGRIKRYEIMWEREEPLWSEIVDAWHVVGTKSSLGDVSHALVVVVLLEQQQDQPQHQQQ
jgi:hypothetical protein